MINFQWISHDCGGTLYVTTELIMIIIQDKEHAKQTKKYTKLLRFIADFQNNSQRIHNWNMDHYWKDDLLV